MPWWQFLVAMGQWGQEHQGLMLTFWGAVVVVLGGREVARLLHRRTRL